VPADGGTGSEHLELTGRRLMMGEEDKDLEEELLDQAAEEEIDDGWDPDYRPSPPFYDWRAMQDGRKAYDQGKPRRAPTLLLLTRRDYFRSRRSWLAGWDFGQKKARQRQQETMAAAIADLMEAVEAYGEARRAGYEGLEESEAVGRAVRVLVQVSQARWTHHE
jgi:hypothetical protein